MAAVATTSAMIIYAIQVGDSRSLQGFKIQLGSHFHWGPPLPIENLYHIPSDKALAHEPSFHSSAPPIARPKAWKW